jgi:ParB family transcriptional regulator, chromosome partitioning protein
MSHVQSIPLSKLAPSPLNARRIEKKVAVEELAASIQAHGLLQGLSVVEVEEGRYQVSAGGRRLAALKLLQKRKVIAGDFPVPCTVIPADIAEETSLAENVQRVAMHPLDEVEAFGRLAASGLLEDAIASRFGTGVRHVRQRLALSALSPMLKTAFRKGELSLDAARAFCLVGEHERQEAVFGLMPKPITNAYAVRSYLTQHAVRASDRLARFVGIEVYEAAGGIVRRDLFEEDLVFLDSPDVLNQLAADKLEALKAPLEEAGWGWVSVNLGHGRMDGGHANRLRPDWREPTEDERAEHDDLTARIAALETEDPDHPDIAGLKAGIAALVDACRSWDAEKLPLAGCVISIDHEGKAVITEGVVTTADQRKINRIDIRRTHERTKAAEARRAQERQEAEAVAADAMPEAGPEPDTGTGVTPIAINPADSTTETTGDAHPGEAINERPPWEDDEPESLVSGYTQKTMLDLTAARSRALRATLCQSPTVSLAIAVYALGCQLLAHSGPVGLSVHAFGCMMGSDADPLASRREALAGLELTEARWFDWCLVQGLDVLLETQATLIASMLDLAHTGTTPLCRRKQAVADTLATRLQLDMTRWWSPTSDFFMGLTKAQISAAIMESPAVAALPTDADRAAFEAQLAGKKKDELAMLAVQSLEGSAWLPGVIATAGLVAAGDDEPGFVVTDEGLEALAASEAVGPDVVAAMGVAAE